MQDDYEVGYKKPPKNSQFRKGIFGNTRGRPRKSLDLSDQLIRESRSFMTIHENGQKIRISSKNLSSSSWSS
ncbi:DUF5681 domain-containing protein [Tunturiibacter gelidoferens]|uniref:DUF5681 domain-containing protein n=1 Tax=Tunturiibacter gelidiferens TaxID=3069689 RepID=A0A9X0U5W0_9BACT|nr:hypothetical protein [Edaphobacter lichenicola]